VLPLASHNDGPLLLFQQHQWSIVVVRFGSGGGWKRGERWWPRHLTWADDGFPRMLEFRHGQPSKGAHRPYRAFGQPVFEGQPRPGAGRGEQARRR
jgi:hypothetical protein